MKQRGFTLVEIIIALAVFAIMASLTSYILAQSFRTDKRLKVQTNQNHQLELAIVLFRREAVQIINRPVRGNQQSLLPAFIAHADTVEFTRGGNINPDSVAKRSTLVRVAYLCNKGSLVRRTWSVLDSPDRTQFHSQVLLDHLKSCSFTYMDSKQQTVSEWKIRPSDKSKQLPPLPLSMTCHLTLENSQSADIIVPLPAGFYG